MDQTVAAQFMDRLVRTAAFMDVALDQFYKKYNVSRVQFLALFYMLEEGEEGVPLSRLGEKMSVSKANITTLVDRMEAGELARRVPDATDRRIIRVTASEKGKKLLEKILPDRENFLWGILEGFSDHELVRANELLEQIRAGIQIQLKNYV